jgi:hypothetical protein
MKERATATGHFQIYAENVVANGYSIVPFLPRTKRPRYKNWTTACFKPTDAVWLHKHRHKFPDDSVGIACGRRVIAVDIDIDDPELADQVHDIARQTLGDTPLVRVGRAPRRALLYRAATDIATKRIGKVEILGTLAAIVAFGVHPESLASYVWRGASPADAPVEKLPLVDAASVEQFITHAADVLGYSARKPAAFTSANDNQPPGATCSAQDHPWRNPPDGALANRMKFGPDGKVVDGREAFLTHLICREFHNGYATPKDLADRVWPLFFAGADITRPKGSGGRSHWSWQDAYAKAKRICQKSPQSRRRRPPAGHHPARHLHSYRRSGYWSDARKALHDGEAARRVTKPSTLIVNRAMLAAVPVKAGQCEAGAPELCKQTGLATSTIKAARAELLDAALWIAERGIYVPVPIGRARSEQRSESKGQNTSGVQTIEDPLYHRESLSVRGIGREHANGNGDKADDAA